MAEAPARSPLVVLDGLNLDDDQLRCHRCAVVAVWDRVRQLDPERITGLLATRADAYVAGPDPELLEAHIAAFCRRTES